MLQSVEDPTLQKPREKYHGRVSVERETVSTSLSQLESALVR